MPIPNLDDRSRSILKALVQTYVATGQPVASGTLARNLRYTVSSATVRNVMAQLERAGFLEQPHTSAGRIPTDNALRLYVESLMNQTRLPAHDAALIDSELGQCAHHASAGELMETASRLLSQLTGNLGFALAPEAGQTRVRHIEFVRLPHPRILVILVSRSGLVTHRVVEMQDRISQEELQTCGNYINTRFAGLDLRSIRALLLRQLRRDKALLESLIERLLSAADVAFAPQADECVYLGGTSPLLEHTASADLARMRAICRTFEERGRMIRVLNACLRTQGLHVTIGCEGLDPDLKGVTVVSAGYDFDGEGGWGLGVMGPTPMPYPRVVSIVEQIARRTRSLLAEMNAS